MSGVLPPFAPHAIMAYSLGLGTVLPFIFNNTVICLLTRFVTRF